MLSQLKKKLKKAKLLLTGKETYMVLAWRYKRQVTVFSSAHSAATKEKTRTLVAGKKVTLQKPVLSCDYTENMGAADKADHYFASYAFSRKSTK